jgi:hypothetical protein
VLLHRLNGDDETAKAWSGPAHLPAADRIALISPTNLLRTACSKSRMWSSGQWNQNAR